MIEHITILLTLVNLFLGIGIIIYLYLKSSFYKSPVLRYLSFYSIFFNACIGGIFFDNYIKLNLNDILLFIESNIYGEISRFMISLLIIGMLYSLFRLSLNLKNSKFISLHRNIIIIVISLFVTTYVLKYLIIQKNITYSIISLLHNQILNHAILIEIPILLFLFTKIKNLKDQQTNKSARYFSFLFLLRYIIILCIIPIILIVPKSKIIITETCFLLFNLIPVIWTKRYFIPNLEEAQNLDLKKKKLDLLLNKHSLSTREKEILTLIIQWKSNKEISDELFIAIPTVKNHIHNIFQKLNIKSRKDLFNLME